MKLRKPIPSQGTRDAGFTLVELLVVIGIIALLYGMFMPALVRVQAQSNSISCKSNLRSVGILLSLYANANEGVLFPIGAVETNSVPPPNGTKGLYRTLGNGSIIFDPVLNADRVILPQERWPAYVFDGVWNPPLLVCPNDDPAVLASVGQQHSYILNHYLEYSPQFSVRLGGTVVSNPGTPQAQERSAAETVVMGEKNQAKGDYYMESGEFTSTPPTVDLYKHGLTLGSNYLYMDWHVSTEEPTTVETSLDPWDVGGVAGTQPSNGP